MTIRVQASQEEQRAGAEAFAEKFLPAFEDMLCGQPAQMMESFLSIDDKTTAMVVDFALNNNQRYVHQEVFEQLEHWRDGFEAVIANDRQATMTSMFQGAGFSFVISFPNIHLVHVFQDKDTGEQLMNRLGLFWGRLNPWLLNHDGLIVKKVGDSKNELALEFWEGGKLLGRSSYLIISAGSREFGAGIAPNFILYDEYDLYPDLSLVARIDAAKGPNCKTVKLSTPRGMKQLYTDYTAAKEGKSAAKAIALFCFQNDANRMRPGHPLSPPAYRHDFALLPEHEHILGSAEWHERSIFETPADAKDFFRWWEWKRQEIRQRLAVDGIYDEERIRGEMEAEHMTNDRTCWRTLGKSPFSAEILDDYEKTSRLKPAKWEGPICPGVTMTVYESPQRNMVYACGMDCAEGAGLGDDAVAFIKDALGNYVATFRGSGTFDLMQMTKAMVYELWKYGKDEREPLFAPERDGGWGGAVVTAARDMGYRNFWKTPPKPGEDYDKYSLKPERFGWRTQGNKEEMKQFGVARFNNRDNRIWDLRLQRAMTNFDPQDQKRHTPDDLMAYFITEAITNPDHPKGFGRQFATMCATLPVFSGTALTPTRLPAQTPRGWGRTSPKPFVMR